MRPPDEAKAGIEAEIIAAERALANGNLLEARRRLEDAEKLGASPREIQMLSNAIDSRERYSRADRTSSQKRAKGAVWAGLGVGFLGYLILSIQQPTDWTPIVWALLAFGLVPILCGLTTGAMQGADEDRRNRFWAGFRAAFIAMLGYSAITLIVLRARIGSDADSGQILVVGIFVTLVYALISGIVAGLAGAKLVKGKSR